MEYTRANNPHKIGAIGTASTLRWPKAELLDASGKAPPPPEDHSTEPQEQK